MNEPLALRDQIYLFLREEILEGRLKVGERLKQEELAKKMNASRMPVREAIQKLEKEGLIVRKHNKGAVVSTFDHEHLNEVYMLRKTLEQMAVELAVPHLTSEKINYLLELNKLFEKAANDRSYDKMLETNEKFHFTLYECCGFSYLLEMLRDLWNKFPRYTFDIISDQGKNSFYEHMEIIEACQNNDAKKAGEKTKVHIENAKKALLKELKNKSFYIIND
ncbi:GntR family transcriptional regulator [Natranaerofaba carboxydovora]|uniref:GntR family transcriptional regulator n=1 Tax=Natranaerofaba carboxydovora TaxID=2742683 RepID=UPI001F1461E4|nr:GntR family transcriptional regulator [Natranaerofaba carboxydovora]UMZ74183.1 HTH-type transcriptional repressor RspR [Natranaerofaba carboxydovora]